MRSMASFTTRYAAMHGVYQGCFSVVFGYVSAYMTFMGYSDAYIGIVVAIANAFAAVLQPVTGNFLDRQKKISLYQFSSILLIAASLLAVVLLFRGVGQMPRSILLIAIAGLYLLVQPLVNAINFMLESLGVSINFGMCRGIGSVCYAAVSVFLGYVFVKISIFALPVFYIIFFMGLVALFVIFANIQKKLQQNAPQQMSEDGSTGALSLGAFAVKYKRFIVWLIGLALFMAMHFAGAYFMLQIVTPLGGGTKEMGIVLAIQAVVEFPAMAVFVVLNKKWSSSILLKISFVVFILKYIGTAFAASIGGLYLVMLLEAGSYGLFYPAAAVYVDRLLPKEDLVKGQSLLTTMFTVSGIFASLFSGFLMDLTTTHNTLLVFLGISVVGLIIAWITTEKVK